MLTPLVLLAALLTAPPLAPNAPATPAASDRAALPAKPALSFDRVAVIGASVTAGFMTSITVEVDGSPRIAPLTLGHVVAQSITPPKQPVLNSGNLLFFTDPLRIGTRIAGQARGKEPSLVVALDYLFWFGYGEVVPPSPPESEQARLARLEQGLALLDQFTCPIVAGDFPDMSESVGKMLAPSQMPALETLEKLNARVREWASDRPRVILFPLSDLVRKLRSGETIIIGPNEWPAGSDTMLLQSDRLHPTPEGMVAIASEFVERLRGYEPTLDDSRVERDAEKLMQRVKADAVERRRPAPAPRARIE